MANLFHKNSLLRITKPSRSHAPAWECIVHGAGGALKGSHAGAWEPVSLQPLRQLKNLALILFVLCVTPTVSAEQWYSIGEDPEGKIMHSPVQLEKYPLAENAEKHYPPNMEFTLWLQDDTAFKPQGDDEVKIEKVLEKEVETHKLEGEVPDIGFQSGKVNIPDSYVEKLRDVLQRMKNRTNVRLHFIGHSDADKLSPALRAKYINNIGLSKYRAQETAEYFPARTGSATRRCLV